MEKLKLSEIAAACGGTFNRDCEIKSICIDTRKITKGCLFICIKGERFDAHQFASDAIKLGAAAVMIHSDIDIDAPFVKVENTAKALLTLGGYYRSKFDIPLIGLTGSVGKTTTKEFTYLVASAKYKTIKTPGNLNNEIGLPQVLFQIDRDTQAAVIEMGMNHFGEIERLANAAKPTMAIITNIGVSHIENLGSREGILQAKLEITKSLKKGAPLILNGDNDLLSTVKSDEHNVAFFGIECDCDFKASDIVEKSDTTEFTVNYYGKSQRIIIPTVGIHNVYNALSAFAAGYFLNIDAEPAANALAKYMPEGMRQRVVKANGVTVIEDCYNASPDSMKAALKTLANIEGGKKTAVLADMLELGDYSKKAHSDVGKAVFENNIDVLLTFGEMGKVIADGAASLGMKEVYHFDTKDALAAALLKNTTAGASILFKASRGMKLEDVIHTFYDRWGK